MIVVNWSCTKMDELEIEGLNNLVLEVDDFDENSFGIQAFRWEFKVSFLYFF